MDPRSTRNELRAPGASGGAGSDLPAVDDRLIAPGSRHEVIDGRLVHVAPADEPHGSKHSKISALLEAHAAGGFDVAVDMLTRTSETGDMAPDASVFPSARDPRTGGRQIEQLAFEVVSTERLADAAVKAARLAARGVRRVFAVDVARQRALEWSVATGTWEILGPDAVVDDPALAVPLPVEPLVRAGKADDAIARALLRKGNPILTAAVDAGRSAGRLEGRAEGQAEGKAEAVLAVLAKRGLRVSEAQERAIRGIRDAAALDDLLGRAVTCTGVQELFER